MVNWLPFPFLRLTLVLAAGLYMGMKWEWPLTELWCLWVAVILGFWILIWKLKGLKFQIWNPCIGLLALLAILIAGILRVRCAPNFPDHGIPQAQYYWVRVLEPPLKTGKYRRILTEVKSYYHNGQAGFSSNRVLCYLDSATRHPLHYGDLLLIGGAPAPIAEPANPFQFNYRRFQSLQRIHWQHRVKDSQILIYRSRRGVSLRHWIFTLRDHLQAQINRHIPHKIPAEITGALLLGNRRALSDQVEEAFADSGAIHILAVSGLHLGILYGALFYLIGHWRHRPYLKWLFLLLTLGTLWSFALITGLAASTLRSASMFSIMLLSKCRNRMGNSYNSLALSAAIILLFEPSELYAVGFQLSYAALGGILYLQPKISRWYQPRNRISKFVWDLQSVSMAAQVGVFPLGIYYFNQFPLYFLISNLLLIPLTFVILWTGLIFLISGFWESMSCHLGQILSVLTNTSFKITRTVASLPGSTWKDLYITIGELALIYFLVGFIIQYCLRFKRYYLQAALTLWLILVTWGYFRYVSQEGKKLIVVYQLPGHQAMDFIVGHRYHSVFSKGLSTNHDKIKYNLAPLRVRLGLKPCLTTLPSKGTESLQAWMFDEKLVILARGPFEFAGKYRIETHILIASNNAVRDLSKLMRGMDIHLLVADGSNSRSVIEKLKAQAQLLNLPFHSLMDEGGKIINLSGNP